MLLRTRVEWMHHRKGARPSFLKSLQRPVSRTAHFNVSVSGLQEGPDWPLYKARSVKNPPTFPQTHHPKAPSHALNYVMLQQVLSAGVNFLLIFHSNFEIHLLHLYEWKKKWPNGCLPWMGGGGVGWHRNPDPSDHRLSCFRKHVHTHSPPCMKTAIRRRQHASLQTGGIPPIYPKARPPDLVSHCSFGELSKPSFTVKRHERHLTLSLSWWLTFTTPPTQSPPSNSQQIIHTQLTRGVVLENTWRIKKHSADWEDAKIREEEKSNYANEENTFENVFLMFAAVGNVAVVSVLLGL